MSVQESHQYAYDSVNQRWVPVGTATSGVSVAEGTYNTPPPALANGQVASLQLNSEGDLKVAEQFGAQAEDNTNAIVAIVPKPLAVSTYTASVSTNQAAANATSVKASAGNVFSLIVYNTNGLARFLFLVNTAGTPTGASASLISPILVPSGAQVVLGEDFFGQTGVSFATGIGAAIMTTAAGGTLATAAETWWTIRFR